MRAAAYLLRAGPLVINRNGEAGLRNAWDWFGSRSDQADMQLPRALFIQIQMLVQKRCGELERELLQYLQRSLFDPKTRNVKALPHSLVMVLLLSIYNFHGVKSWVRCQSRLDKLLLLLTSI